MPNPTFDAGPLNQAPVVTKGACEHCGGFFSYSLVHNGFHDSAYAYCEACGMCALFSGWFRDIPKDVSLTLYGPLAPTAEPFLRPCLCGGHFRANAKPRCPHCSKELCAEKAARYIESNAPGTRLGWRWQRNWVGVYSIVIENRFADNPWMNPWAYSSGR